MEWCEETINNLDQARNRPPHDWRRIGAIGAALVSGGLASCGILNVRGVESAIGPIETTTTLSSGPTSLRYGADMVRFDDDSPPPFGAAVEIRNFRSFEANSLQEAAPYLQDTAAIKEIIATDALKQYGTFFFLGVAASSFALYLGKNSRHSPRAVAGLALAGLAASSSLAVGDSSQREWTTLKLDSKSFSVSGPTAREAAEYLETAETYYDALAESLSGALEPVAKEDQARGDTPLLFVTDHHCNLGQYRVIEAAARALGADTILNAGDETTNTAMDGLCLELRAARLSDIKHRINILGNHDNNDIAEQYRSFGETVLNGDRTTVHDVTIGGFTDYTITPFGAAAYPRDDTDYDQYHETLRQNAARSPADIFLVHNPDDAEYISPYATVTLSGHTHAPNGPTNTLNGTWEYTGGTSGGAGIMRPTAFDRLGADASFAILYVNDGELTGVREITIRPDQTIDITDVTPLPVEPTEPIRPSLIR